MQKDLSNQGNEIFLENVSEEDFTTQNNQNIELGRLNDFLMNHHDELDDEEFEELEDIATKIITLEMENKNSMFHWNRYLLPDIIVPEFMRHDKY